MRIDDFVDEGLGHSSYLIDIGDGTTALVAPPSFPSFHEALAAGLGSRIAWTFDTHSHADYTTGSPGLADRRLIDELLAPAAAQQRSSQISPRQASRPSFAASAAMAMAAIGSAHHQPPPALRIRPPSRIADR